MIMEIDMPTTEECAAKLTIRNTVYISGSIFCGRDAVLPKMIQMARENENFDHGIELKDSVIFHTAISPARVGSTSSNKLEVEDSTGPLSKTGVKLYLGKDEIGRGTIETLNRSHAVYAIIPPVTTLLDNKTRGQELVAFPELGMGVLYRLKVERYPATTTATHGKNIYEQHI